MKESSTRYTIGALEDAFPDLYSAFIKLMEEAEKNGLELRSYPKNKYVKYRFLNEAAVQQEDKEREGAK